MTPTTCDDVAATAAELAAGTAPGDERAAAAEHLSHCPACRADVAGLTDAVEALLQLSPVDEPSPGFEARVVSRFTRSPATRWRRVLVAAAVVAVVVAGGVIVRVAGDGDAPAVVAAELRAGDGRPVGHAYLRDAGWLVVDVEYLGGDGTYTVQLVLDGGRRVDAGELSLRWGSGLLAVPTPAGADVDGVRLVGADGEPGCQAMFS